MNLIEVYKAPPKQKSDETGKNLALAAAGLGLIAATGGAAAAVPAIGGALGIGAGTAGMMAAGGAMGSAGAQLYGALREKPNQPKYEGNIGYSESAIGRRMAAFKDPVNDLIVAQQELEKSSMPYEQKLEYMRPINQALEKYKERYA